MAHTWVQGEAEGEKTIQKSWGVGPGGAHPPVLPEEYSTGGPQ